MTALRSIRGTQRLLRLLFPTLLFFSTCMREGCGFRALPPQFRPPARTRDNDGRRLRATPPQVLEFREPTTDVTVVLVGAMHYNPASIRLAVDTVRKYAVDDDRLHSVVVESCDVRWNKTAELYDEKPIWKNMLQNEMRSACDAAFAAGRPVVLGDQRIDVISAELKKSLLAALRDLFPTGWQRGAREVSEAWKATVPFGGDGYLTSAAFFDPRLLLFFPVSLVKYPLSFLVRDPVPTSAVLLTLFGLTLVGDSADAASVLQQQQQQVQSIPLSEWLLSLSVAALETAIFARVLLKPMLADRNVVLAESILTQCRLCKAGRYNADDTANTADIIYAPGGPDLDSATLSASLRSRTGGNDGGVVVAILGMAHCNGIKKLLREKLV